MTAPGNDRRRQVAWFLALWVAGVLGVAALGLVIKLLLAV